jgi:Leucine Rich repeat
MRQLIPSSAGWTIETYSIDLICGGLAIVALAWVWLILRAFYQRGWWGFGSLAFPPIALLFAWRHAQKAIAPLIMIALGLAAVSCPLVYSLLAPADLGLREKLSHGPKTIAPAWSVLQSMAAHDWMETRAFYMQSGGVAVAAITLLALLWRGIHRHRRRSHFKPSTAQGDQLASAPRHQLSAILLPAILAMSVLVAVTPALYTLYVPLDLGPLEMMVEGQRHLTVTGWDRKDYSFLRLKPDIVVLQMANPDVTDSTLENLKGLKNLKELDLSDTQITDAGLLALKDLPALEALRLARTKITDQGFRTALLSKESLLKLDVQKTGVRAETIKDWREKNPNRQAHQ